MAFLTHSREELRITTIGRFFMEKSFVARNLRKCISYRDILNNATLKNEEKRIKVAARAAKVVEDKDLFKGVFDQINVKGKPAYTTNNIECSLILRLLSKNIKIGYDLKPSNRENIVSTLISFLKESSSCNIHRFDIKSFYESIDRVKVLKKIKDDGKLSKINTILLKAFIEELEDKNIPGFPRGLGISAILSELIMQSLDNNIKCIDGVYYFGRFVDDIIVITSEELKKKETKSLVKQLVPTEIELHEVGKKIYFDTSHRTNDKRDLKICEFSYLGYSYSIKNKNHIDEKFIDVKRRDVEIRIDPEKIDKLKQKVIKSFCKYVSSRAKSKTDYDILVKRLKFLTGNYNLINVSTTSNLRSGLYFNYKLINSFDQLLHLDTFFRGLLFDKKYKLSRRIQYNIPIKKRRDIVHFSFYKGFLEKRYHKFKYKDFLDIKQAWL